MSEHIKLIKAILKSTLQAPLQNIESSDQTIRKQEDLPELIQLVATDIDALSQRLVRVAKALRSASCE